jgi:Bromodomain
LSPFSENIKVLESNDKSKSQNSEAQLITSNLEFGSNIVKTPGITEMGRSEEVNTGNQGFSQNPIDDTPKNTKKLFEFKSVTPEAPDSRNLIVKSLYRSDEMNESSEFVDMYTYHLGREGLELGDYPIPTDTGYHASSPPTKVPVQVVFPLDEGGLELWKEEIEWDLTDESTLTPLAFAHRTAQEFGLSFDQTMELATSIQQQLDASRLSVPSYPETVITLNDPLTNRPRTILTNKSRPCHLYGSSDSGGWPMKAKKGQKGLPPPSSISDPASKPISSKTTPSQASNKKNRSELNTYRFKTPLQIREEVQKRARQECNFTSNVLSLKLDSVCHLCTTKRNQGFMFACCNPSHVYCMEHCLSELSLGVTADVQITLSYCPICCVSCPCNKCQKRLDQVACEFQRRSIEFGNSEPEDTPFDQILLYCSGQVPKCRKLPAQSSKSRNEKHPIVSKVPPEEFPRETSGGRDLEPGTEMDYRTVFTEQGAYLLSAEDPVFATSALIPVKPNYNACDGNVDYCQKCQKGGDLQNCDFCPRAFHTSCRKDLPSLTHTKGKKRMWECPTCLKEKEDLPDYLITGKGAYEGDDGNIKECLTVICDAFAHVVGDNTMEQISAMKILSIILEMVQQVMDYDFGDIFQEPVDLEAIPEYEALIKEPMDLGTISTRLVNGHYAKLYNSEGKGWNGIIAQVLMDIELVWHNCFTFNLEGSGIYRMAEVCARRARNIFSKSIVPLLADEVKQKIEDYVKGCELERLPSAPSTSKPVTYSALPKSTHKIRVAWSPAGKCRSIAVFDSDTGRIVKLYSSLKSALSAVKFLGSLGYSCEVPSLTDYAIQMRIRGAKTEPKLTLFGYRWCYFDDLRSGQIVFDQDIINLPSNDWSLRHKDDCFIQMAEDQAIYIFLSVEEAISFSRIPRDVPLASLKSRLEVLPYNEWVPLGGLKWRKLSKESEAAVFSDLKNSGEGSSSTFHRDIIEKNDTLSGRRLVTFTTFEAAYKDFRHSCQLSPLKLELNKISLKAFQDDFLDGDKTIDGQSWKLIEDRGIQSAKRSNSKQRDALNIISIALGKRPRDTAQTEANDHPQPPAKKTNMTEASTESTCNLDVASSPLPNISSYDQNNVSVESNTSILEDSSSIDGSHVSNPCTLLAESKINLNQDSEHS